MKKADKELIAEAEEAVELLDRVFGLKREMVE